MKEKGGEGRKWERVEKKMIGEEQMREVDLEYLEKNKVRGRFVLNNQVDDGFKGAAKGGTDLAKGRDRGSESRC